MACSTGSKRARIDSTFCARPVNSEPALSGRRPRPPLRCGSRADISDNRVTNLVSSWTSAKSSRHAWSSVLGLTTPSFLDFRFWCLGGLLAFIDYPCRDPIRNRYVLYVLRYNSYMDQTSCVGTDCSYAGTGAKASITRQRARLFKRRGSAPCRFERKALWFLCDRRS